MKPTIAFILTLVIGFSAGWLSFRSKEMSEYRNVFKKAGITEEQLIEAYKSIPTMMENMESEDRMSAMISLAALRMLEENRIEETKAFLAMQAASYFVIYGPPDNPEKEITEERLLTLQAIEKAISSSAILEATVDQYLADLRDE